MYFDKESLISLSKCHRNGVIYENINEEFEQVSASVEISFDANDEVLCNALLIENIVEWNAVAIRFGTK